MDEINKNWLTNQQQKVFDSFTLWFEHNSLLPEDFNVSLICNDILWRMILCPGEIEELILWNDTLIPIDVLRKLYTFRYYFWEEIEKIEKNLTDGEISRALKIMKVWNILDVFKDTGFTSFKNQTRKFTIYFLVIEDWYEQESGTPLSFSGLSQPTEYNDYIGF